jgi:FtsZ-binding cell division protein ZapB
MTRNLFDLAEETDPLETKSFEALEDKITQVLERLKTLQAEKQELQRLMEMTQGRLDEAESKIEELTRERDALQQNQRDPGQEELIKSKIAALLSRLEAAA